MSNSAPACERSVPGAKLIYKATIRSNDNNLGDFDSLAQRSAMARVSVLYGNCFQYDRKQQLHLYHTATASSPLEAVRMPAICIANFLSDRQCNSSIYIHFALSDGRQRTQIFSLQAMRLDLMLFLSFLVNQSPDCSSQVCPLVLMDAQGNMVEAQFQVDGEIQKVQPYTDLSKSGKDYYDQLVECSSQSLFEKRLKQVLEVSSSRRNYLEVPPGYCVGLVVRRHQTPTVPMRCFTEIQWAQGCVGRHSFFHSKDSSYHVPPEYLIAKLFLRS